MEFRSGGFHVWVPGTQRRNNAVASNLVPSNITRPSRSGAENQEMDSSEKNQISHRRLAVAAMKRSFSNLDA
jgi:hypothetical protein